MDPADDAELDVGLRYLSFQSHILGDYLFISIDMYATDEIKSGR